MYAISGPAKLPRPIVDKLNAAIQDYLKSPSGVARMDESAVLPKRGGKRIPYPWVAPASCPVSW